MTKLTHYFGIAALGFATLLATPSSAEETKKLYSLATVEACFSQTEKLPEDKECIRDATKFITTYDGQTFYTLFDPSKTNIDKKVTPEEYCSANLNQMGYSERMLDKGEGGFNIGAIVLSRSCESLKTEIFSVYDINKDGVVSSDDDLNKDNSLTLEDKIIFLEEKKKKTR